MTERKCPYMDGSSLPILARWGVLKRGRTSQPYVSHMGIEDLEDFLYPLSILTFVDMHIFYAGWV